MKKFRSPARCTMRRVSAMSATLTLLTVPGAATAVGATAHTVMDKSVTLVIATSDDVTSRFYTVKTVLPTNCVAVVLAPMGTCSYTEESDSVTYDHASLETALKPFVHVSCTSQPGDRPKNFGHGVIFNTCAHGEYDFERKLNGGVTFVISGAGRAPGRALTAVVENMLRRANYLGRRRNG